MPVFGFSPHDRVATFIDGQSIYIASKSAEFDMDFKKLTALIASEGRLVRNHYFTAMSDTEDYNAVRPLVDWLGYNGFTVVTKSLKDGGDAENRRRKGNINVDMSVHALDLADAVDQMIIFSGDGDLVPLVEALQRKGVRVTVISSKDGTQPMISDDLRRQADVFIDIKDIADKIRRDIPSPAPTKTFEVQRKRSVS